MNVRENRGLMWTVAGLYVAEGLPAGIFHDLVQVWLLEAHAVSLTELGLVSLLAMPWTFKALWSPLVDRFGTAARWISAALLSVGLVTVALPWLPPGIAVWVMLGVLTTASATADVAIDGYTATVVPAALHGRVNGWRVAAYRAAMLVAGGGAVAAAAWIDWRWIFGCVGLCTVALALWTARLAPISREQTDTGEWLAELFTWLSQPGSWALFLFVLLFKMGDAAMAPMVKPFWLQGAGLGLAELGLVSITLGAALTVAGALLGGELATRWGLFKALWVLGAAQAISNLGYMAAAMHAERWMVYGASMIESFCSGLGVAAFLAFLMRICEARQAATRFAMLTALSMVARNIAGAPSGWLVEQWGFAGYFGFTFVLALPAFALLPRVRRRVSEVVGEPG
jgi:MFS transporter, PAT family, beta-lactamase induction signal transducer AmpG